MSQDLEIYFYLSSFLPWRKKKQKSQGSQEKYTMNFTEPKRGRVILEQVPSFPVLLRLCFIPGAFFLKANRNAQSV